MRRYFTPTAHQSLRPPAFMRAKDHNAAWAAMLENKPYAGAFSADEFKPDAIRFSDFIEVEARIPIVSKRLRDAMLADGIDDLNFYEATVLFGSENLMNRIGDAVGGLYCATYKHVVDVIDDVDPVRFWPHLKKFKAENYVITRPLPDGAAIAVDREKPFMPICTEGFKQWCEGRGLNVGFVELPTFVDRPAR